MDFLIGYIFGGLCCWAVLTWHYNRDFYFKDYIKRKVNKLK